jgi:hypothetical protein
VNNKKNNKNTYVKGSKNFKNKVSKLCKKMHIFEEISKIRKKLKTFLKKLNICGIYFKKMKYLNIGINRQASLIINLYHCHLYHAFPHIISSSSSHK